MTNFPKNPPLGDYKIPGIDSTQPWYDLKSNLTDEEELDVLQILMESHIRSGDQEAIRMLKEWERTLSDRIAAKALLE